jgi:hypothetical protein
MITAASLSSLIQSPRNADGEVVVFSFREPLQSLRKVENRSRRS